MRTSRRAIAAVVCVLAVACGQALGGALRPPVAPPAALGRVLPAQQLGALRHASLAGLNALCEMGGQMYGAGGGRVSLINESGQVTRNIPTRIARVAGISPYAQGTLIIGDSGIQGVHSLNVATGQTALLFTLRQLRAQDPIAQGILPTGVVASVGSDGRAIYVGVSAGYSSSILKIDPARRQVLAHAWAPGPEPIAMAFDGANLFVLDQRSAFLRRYDAALRLSHDRIRVPVAGATGLIIRAGDEVRVLAPAAQSIIRLKADLPTLRLAIPPLRLRVGPKIIIGRIVVSVIARKVAVLICGDVAESGYNEFWNDTLWMYRTLRAAGYGANDIYVLYGDGHDHASANPAYQVSPAIADFAATVANVNMVFDGLKNGDAAHGITQMRSIDTLFVWTFDHGGGTPPNCVLCLRDGNMSSTAFAARLNPVPCVRRAIFMQQCRSGGFIPNLRGATTFISAACQGTEDAHRADAENELYGGEWYCHGEYNYHIISALSGASATGAAVNADANHNGHVSAREAADWNGSHESRSETPQMDDAAGIGSAFYTK